MTRSTAASPWRANSKPFCHTHGTAPQVAAGASPCLAVAALAALAAAAADAASVPVANAAGDAYFRRRALVPLRSAVKDRSAVGTSLDGEASGGLITNGAAACPCSDSSLCEPVGGPPLREKEVFGFNPGSADASGNYPGVDLDVATTVAWPRGAAFVCAAHKRKVKVIIQPPAINLTALRDPSARAAYATSVVDAVRAAYADGVTFDYESPVADAADADAYTAAVREATAALHRANPGYQATVCVAWSPDGIDGRQYDYRGLAEASDALYVMDYDTRSQILDVCVASANAPLAGAERGVGRYLDLGIPANRLILGVPWYGYRYPCLDGTPPTSSLCPIREVPFRGVNCSDAAGSEIPYSVIMSKLGANATTTGLQWDSSTSSVWFNAVEPADDGASSQTVQYWFDDDRSLALKYGVASKLGLRGTGPYTFSDAGPGDDGRRMWAALAKFREDAH